MGAQRQADRVQPEIGAAALVGNRKPVAADPHLAAADHGKSDAAGADDHDAALARAVRAEAGGGRVMGVDDGAEGVRPDRELIGEALAADAGKPGRDMQRAERVGVEPGVGERGATGLLHLGDRALDPEPQRGRTRDAGAEQAAARVLDARPAAGAAAVDAGEQRIVLHGGRRHCATRRMSAPHCTSLRSSNS